MTDETMQEREGWEPPVPDDAEDDDPVAAAAPDEGDSLLDGLRAQREQLVQEQEQDVEVPNNGGLLWATYRLLPWAEVRHLVRGANSRDPQGELLAQADFLARSCSALFLRDPSTGQRAPWPGYTGIGDDEVVTYSDPRVVAALGIPPLPPNARPRDAVRLILVRDFAVSSHFVEVMRWMEGAHDAVSRDFAAG